MVYNLLVMNGMLKNSNAIMKTRLPTTSLCVSLALCLFPVPKAHAAMASITADASSFFFDPSTGGPNGFYEHGTTIQNYQVGYNSTTEENTRNWFIFPIPSLGPGESIGAATVSFYMPIFPPNSGFGYDSHDPTEEFAIFGLSPAAKGFISAAAILDDGGVPDDGPLFDMWWADVDSGPELGSTIVSKADEGGFVTITFTPLGLDVLNAAVGGDLLIGGAVPTLPVDPYTPDLPEGFFHHTHPYGVSAPPGGETDPAELVIDIVPEPTTMMLLSLGGISLLRRRKIQ